MKYIKCNCGTVVQERGYYHHLKNVCSEQKTIDVVNKIKHHRNIIRGLKKELIKTKKQIIEEEEIEPILNFIEV